MLTVDVFIIGNWNTFTFQVNESLKIGQFKSQIKDMLSLDCSTHQMKVFKCGYCPDHLGKLSFEFITTTLRIP